MVLNILTQYPFAPFSGGGGQFVDPEYDTTYETNTSAGANTAANAAMYAVLPEDGTAPTLQLQASGSHLDLNRVPYCLYGVKYIDPVSLAPVSGRRPPALVCRGQRSRLRVDTKRSVLYKQ